MKVAFDASFLLYFVAEADQVGNPLDEAKQPVRYIKERVEALIAEFESAGTLIVIPTPAISEVMVRAGVEAGQEYIRRIKKSRVFSIASFDERAAIETAIMAGDRYRCPSLRPMTDATRTKIKYDRQIVSIAVVEGAKILYTDDTTQASFARRHRIDVIGIADCPVPDIYLQGDLFGRSDNSRK